MGKTSLSSLLLGLAVISTVIAACYASACAESGVKTKKSMTDSKYRNEKGAEKMTGSDRLSNEQGSYLLKLARETIKARLLGGSKDMGDEKPPEVFNERRGTFVTLTKAGALRGCIGHIIARESLLEGVEENAVNAAFKDPRFPPLSPDELDDIDIEVSILTDPEPLEYSDRDDLLEKLRPHVDGVIIKKGYNQATFLPQVWDQLPDKGDFLRHLCLKAGLAADAWTKGDLDVSTYQVQAFEEE